MDVSSVSSDVFATLPLFEGVKPVVLRDLSNSARTVVVDKGATFLTQGHAINRFFVVLEGWCGASKGNAEGQEAILQIFRRGDFLPEPDRLTATEPSRMNLVALTSARVLTLTPEGVRRAMDQSPVFAANLLSASVQRGQELRDHIEQLTLHSAEQRVGRFLLQMRFHNVATDGDDIVLPFDKALIAAYLGIKPETLSRTLQFFKESGFVIERNHLVVPDRQALCDYCDQATMRSCRFAHTDDCLNSAHSDLAL